MAGDGGQGGEALSRDQLLLRAGATLACGVALCAVFSDPLVESLTNLSRCAGAWRIGDRGVVFPVCAPRPRV
jgi:hypothetical protein